MGIAKISDAQQIFNEITHRTEEKRKNRPYQLLQLSISVKIKCDFFQA